MSQLFLGPLGLPLRSCPLGIIVYFPILFAFRMKSRAEFSSLIYVDLGFLFSLWCQRCVAPWVFLWTVSCYFICLQWRGIAQCTLGGMFFFQPPTEFKHICDPGSDYQEMIYPSEYLTTWVRFCTCWFEITVFFTCLSNSKRCIYLN